MDSERLIRRDEMKDLGITQLKLAIEAECSMCTVQKWLSERLVRPHIRRRLELAYSRLVREIEEISQTA